MPRSHPHGQDASRRIEHAMARSPLKLAVARSRLTRQHPRTELGNEPRGHLNSSTCKGGGRTKALP
jgi:hypothetical protein